MIKTCGRGLFGGTSKNEQIHFFDSQMYLPVILTINLKLFRNHGGIYRFRKKFKKVSGEINPLGVHRNMRGCILEVHCEGLGNRQYVCLPFCWSWPESWDNFQKIISRKKETKWGYRFWNRRYRTSAHWYWRLKKISCRACLLFYYFFWW